MVATVGSISIDLSTNAAKFATGFKSAATTVETQSGRMAKSIASLEKNTALAAGTLKSLGTGLAAGVGLAALTSLGGAFDKLKETISEYDAILADSKSTGLRTDTYQALAFAAKQANVEQDTFNSSLSIFAKNAGLAVHGTGALYAGLKNLNPALLQNILNTKDQEERLKLVADAMAQTTDATQKMALSTIVFGKGGGEMARILEQGRASIEKFKKTAQDLGIIVPDDLLNRAGELDDKLDVLYKIIHVQLGEALINLGPVLTDAIGGLAGLSKEVNGVSASIDDFVKNPSLSSFTDLLSKITGLTIIPGSLADNTRKALGDLGRTFDDLTTNTSDESTKAIAANIQYLEDLLANLKQAAAEGQDVHLEIDDAQAKLKALRGDLDATKAAGISAANAISAGFAEAFRNAENASMAALAAMNSAAAAATSLPTVHRYGQNPNDFTPQGFNTQSNVNGSGVGVTSLSNSGMNVQQNVNGSGVSVLKPSVDKTSDNTQATADNVSSLDRNTKSYLQNLSSDIGGYTAQTNVTINKLSDLTGQTFGMLSQEILAALVLKTDTADNSTAGNGFLTHDQVFIPGMGHTARSIGSYHLAPTTSDGTSNTSVQVAQPGSNITLNYTAAPGESEQTARQRARDMWDELVKEASRA